MLILSEREDGITLLTLRAAYFNWYGDYETVVSIDEGRWRVLEGYNYSIEASIGHSKYDRISREELINFDYIG
ncbi:MAG: hypothetical protein J6D12_04265 [Peptostreptococcaceae bacterium]|nr:hypothetical protein [Peptostreptococcaceae bacterium]